MDSTIGKEGQFFKYLDKFRDLGIEDLPQQILIEGFAVNVQFLENKTGEIIAVAYLRSIVEFISTVQQIGIGVLVNFNKYILGLIWGNNSISIQQKWEWQSVQLWCSSSSKIRYIALIEKLCKISL